MDNSVYGSIHKTWAQSSADGNGQVAVYTGQKGKRERLRGTCYERTCDQSHPHAFCCQHMHYGDYQ
jgi:hypothetical protein